MNIKQISSDEYWKLYDSEWWIGKTPVEIVNGGFFVNKSPVPWPVLQKALSEVLGRHITNEDVMRNLEGLRKEFLSKSADVG